MIAWVLACSVGSEADFKLATGSAPPAEPEPEMVAMEEEAIADDEDQGFRAKRNEGLAKSSPRPASAPPPPPGSGRAAPDDDAAPATRSWFPETFLWAPAVVTDGDGRAAVPAVLPDSLTTWRVLGLAASAEGAQSGATLEIASSLDIYADPVAPDRLRVGDRVQVPVRLVNTTPEALGATWRASGRGLQAAGGGDVAVPAGGTRVVWFDLQAAAPGAGTLRVALEGHDAVEETLSVTPRGMPDHQLRRGVLGSGEPLELSAPDNATFARARLVLFPGPLGVLRHALDARAGGTVAYALGTRGPALLEALGASVDTDRREHLRRLELVGIQELTATASSGSLSARIAALEALDGGQPGRVAEALSVGVRELVLAEQLPDGSWRGAETLQGSLVLAAAATRAVRRPEATAAAASFFERQGGWLLHDDTGDAYTAAQVLRSGAVDGQLADDLRARVAADLDRSGDLVQIRLPPGVVGPDGRSVSPRDALASAALVVDDESTRAELLAALIASYDPAAGLGPPHEALAVLDALGLAGSAARPDTIAVALKIDGEIATRHELRGDAVAEVAVLEAEVPLSGSHRYEVVSDATWPGLGWQLELQAWTPWDAPPEDGVQLEVEREALTAGKPSQVRLWVSGAPNSLVSLREELPAGLDVVGNIDGVVRSNTTDGAWTGQVQLDGSGLAELGYRVGGALAGELWSGGFTAMQDGELSGWLPPEAFTVARTRPRASTSR